jgi:hypothetical protein
MADDICRGRGGGDIYFLMENNLPQNFTGKIKLIWKMQK